MGQQKAMDFQLRFAANIHQVGGYVGDGGIQPVVEMDLGKVLAEVHGSLLTRNERQ
jgi:hypothetical protein